MDNTRTQNLTIFFGILVSILISHSVSAVPSLSIDQLNSSEYPTIYFELKDETPGSYEPSDFRIFEKFAKQKREVSTIKVKQDQSLKPIEVILSIEPGSNAQRNQFASELALILKRILTVNDKLSIHIQDESRTILYNDITEEELNQSFHIPVKKDFHKSIDSVSRLIDEIPNPEEPPVLLLLVHSTLKLENHKIPDLAKKSRKKGMSLNLISHDFKDVKKIADYTDGKSFVIGEQGYTKTILDYIQWKKKNPFLIEFESSFAKDIPIFQTSRIDLEIFLKGSVMFKYSYKVDPMDRIQKKLTEPQIFLPVSIFLFLIGISLLIFLKNYDPPTSRMVEIDYPAIDSWVLGQPNMENDEIIIQIHDESKIPSQESKSDSRKIALVDKLFTKKPYLIFKSGPLAGKNIPINYTEVVLGRDPDSIIHLDDPSVDWTHAKIKFKEESFYLYDTISESGVYLNQRKVLRPLKLRDFDEIKIGNCQILFREG